MDKLFVNAFSGKEFILHVLCKRNTSFPPVFIAISGKYRQPHIGNTVRNFDKDTY